jgi:hypothetical protein
LRGYTYSFVREGVPDEIRRTTRPPSDCDS